MSRPADGDHDPRRGQDPLIEQVTKPGLGRGGLLPVLLLVPFLAAGLWWLTAGDRASDADDRLAESDDGVAVPTPDQLPDDASGPVDTAPGQDIDLLSSELLRCRQAAPIDRAIVWVPVGAAEQDVAVIDELIGSLATVEQYHYVDQDQTMAEFEDHFADEPEIVELVLPGQLPTSFRLTFVDGVDAAASVGDLESSPTVDEVELQPAAEACLAEAERLRSACANLPVRLVIWMDVEIDQSDVDGVMRTLGGDPTVVDHRYVGVDETYAEFTDYYQGDEEVIDLVEPDQLPTSVEVELGVGVATGELEAALSGLPGVDDVQRTFVVDGGPCIEVSD